MGRTAEAIERRKEKDRIRFAQRIKNEEYRKKRKLAELRRLAEDHERHEKRKQQQREYYQRRKAELNAKRVERFKANKESGYKKETKPEFLNESNKTETVATQRDTSTEQSKILLKEISPSMSLIDESVLHLKELMKKASNLENLEGELPISQLDRVKAATSCAHQIYQLLKVKVDAYKAISKS